MPHLLTSLLAFYLALLQLTRTCCSAQVATTVADDALPRLAPIEPVFTARFLTPSSPANATGANSLTQGLDFLLQAYVHLSGDLKTAPELEGSIARDLFQAASSLGSTSYAGADALLEDLQSVYQKLLLLDQRSSYPALRRVLLAAIVKQRVRASFDWAKSAELQQGFAKLVWQLYVQHRRGGYNKAVTEFLHVSKSGGTSMCALSALNGCRSRDRSLYGNCMMRRFDDNPRWVSHRAHNKTAVITEELKHLRWIYRYHIPRGERDCKYRMQIMKQTNNTFYSNEFAVHGGFDDPKGAHLCSDFLNILMLRDPTKRLLSHIKWIIKVYRSIFHGKWEHFFKGRDSRGWRDFAPAAVNNYYVRLLIGEAAFRRRNLTDEHLTIAKLITLQYDVILVLEARDLNSLTFKWALGWQHALSEVHSRQVRYVEESLEAVLPTEAERQALVADNSLDAQVYDFGALLSNLDGLMYDVAEASGAAPLPGYGNLTAEALACGYASLASRIPGWAAPKDE